MDVHNNARLTPSGRALLAARVEGGWPVKAAALAAGVSTRTPHTWLRRYRQGGERRHHDRSSAPRRCRHAKRARRLAAIAALRRQRLSGPQIAAVLGMLRSTVGAILRRLGLNRLSALEPKPEIVRYERAALGELIHLDIKSLGRIDGIGHRITGKRSGQSRNRGIGWDHLHVAIDDASRLAYVEVLPSLSQGDATAFLERTLAWFDRLGVTVERVINDNGSAYRSKRFAAALAKAGVRQICTRPYTPRTNGKAERSIQTSLRIRQALCLIRRAPRRHRAMGERLQLQPTSLSPRRKAAMDKVEQPSWKRQLARD
ncbi:mobile element protein [Bosea sp. BIWAKO-01]|nr:mobile element protein [Bosea sp. BIWAKO-01]